MYNRNYGCRIKSFIYNGFNMVSLDNNLIKVVINLDKGSDIYEFIYKPLDIDFMYHGSNKIIKGMIPSVSSSKGNFMDYYVGGWQELFPNISEPCKVKSAEYGMHGEVALLPWDMQIITNQEDKISVKLSVQTVRTPYRLIKTLTLLNNVPILYLDEEVINEARQDMEFQWGHHPALGGNFLDDNCEIILKGNPVVKGIDVDLGKVSSLSPSQEGKWPSIQTRSGEYDNLSKVKDMSTNIYNEFALIDIEEGSYMVKNNKLNLGFGLEWDKNIFPYIWVWQMYGGGMDYPYYGRAYTLALEPWSSIPGNLDKCIEKSTAIKIKKGESIKTSLKTIIKTF